MNGMPPITQTGGSSLSTPERVVTTCQPSQATPASMAAVAAKRTARVDATLRGHGRFGLPGCVVQCHFAPPFAAAQSHQGQPSGHTLQPRSETATLLVTP